MISKRKKDFIQNFPRKADTFLQAIDVLKKFQKVKFVESIECVFHFKNKITKQTISVDLPHKSKKNISVALFTDNKNHTKENTNADFIGGEDLIEKVKKDGVFFTSYVATNSFKEKLLSLSSILGPKNLLPKKINISDNPFDNISKIKKGNYQINLDKYGCMQSVIGSMSFSNKKIEENFLSIKKIINDKICKKSFYVYISSTMSPSILVKIK